jgi:hypothetical protein
MMSTTQNGDVAPRQYGATIVKTIIGDRLEALKTLLQSIGNDIDGNPHIPFARLTSAHFMSWFIVDGKGVSPHLFLELNVDGPIEPFLNELVAQAKAGIDLIYSHCAGYPSGGSSSTGQLVRYLLTDDVGYDCYYIGWRGLSKSRILQERTLRAQLETFLDQAGDSTLAGMSPSAVRGMIQEYVAGDPALAWAKTFPPRPFLVRNRDQVLMALKGLGILILLGLIGLAILVWYLHGPWPVVIAVATLVAIVAGFLALLRWHEVTDSQSTAEPDHTQVQTVVKQENKIVQNHFASVAPVKPGLFRGLLLKAVLKLIHVLAAVSANQGSLSGITSIHFARWVVIDGGKNLLFLSNYDGSWENYLDDFIDLASPGLTAIWSNTVGFPRSYFLVGGGARDENLFKTMTRQSQVPSLVWYSAYPDLSVQNIQANAAIREGLFAPMDAAAEQAWLMNF